MSELEAILKELKEIKEELRRGRVNSEYYTTDEAIVKIGMENKPKAAAMILRELKKENLLTNCGQNRWNRNEIDRTAPQINKTLFFDSSNNYKLIKNKKAA